MRLLFKGRNRITSGYRLPERKDHNGLDIVGDDNANVLSVCAGTVYKLQDWDGVTRAGNSMQTYGNLVIIKGTDGRYYYYAHLKSYCVKAGQAVQAGDKLGVMGTTGASTGNHTHFEIRLADNRTRTNPAEYLGVPNKPGTYSLPEGWVQDTLGWYWYQDGEKVKGEWVLDGGYWYYLGSDGRMQKGLQKIGGKLYMLNPVRSQGIPKGACIITDEKGVVGR